MVLATELGRDYGRGAHNDEGDKGGEGIWKELGRNNLVWRVQDKIMKIRVNQG